MQSCQIRTSRRHSSKYLKACDNPGSRHVLHTYSNRYTSIYKLKIGDTNQNSYPIRQHWVDSIDFYPTRAPALSLSLSLSLKPTSFFGFGYCYCCLEFNLVKGHRERLLQYTLFQNIKPDRMWKIVLAAVLSIPCLTVIICTAPIIAVLAIPSLLLLLLRKESSGISSRNPPDHVIIAGGSSGIGLCIARECLKRGVSKITLLARDMKKLESVQQELQTISKEGKSRTKIHIISVSVSDYEQIERAAKENIQWKKSDRVVLFNCAGISYTTEFEKIPHNTLLKLVQTNQLGSMFLVKACLPYLEQGVICLTSSVAGQAAVYGYAGYNPTKCAIRGFAEVMTQELLMAKPKLHIQVAYPEDNKTPGYEYESKMMPEITKKMNETAPLADPKEYVKNSILSHHTACLNPNIALSLTYILQYSKGHDQCSISVSSQIRCLLFRCWLGRK